MLRCDQYCSSNIVTTLVSLHDAIFADVLTVMRLIASCLGRFGISGCVCQLALTLQPLWREVSTNKMVRCEDGDPFTLLLGRLNDLITQGAESLVNFLIDGVNDFIDGLPWPLSNIGRPINRVCFPTGWAPSRCIGGPLTRAELTRMAQCEDSSFGLEEMCFYARVRFEHKVNLY